MDQTEGAGEAERMEASSCGCVVWEETELGPAEKGGKEVTDIASSSQSSSERSDMGLR